MFQSEEEGVVSLFVVKDRFLIDSGRESEFEEAWRTREGHLSEFDGFVSFALLRNEAEDATSTERVSHASSSSRD